MPNRSVNNQALSKSSAFSWFSLASIVAVISVLGFVLSVAGVAFAIVLIYVGLAMFFGANVWDTIAHQTTVPSADYISDFYILVKLIALMSNLRGD